jgi:hypothetical protein
LAFPGLFPVFRLVEVVVVLDVVVLFVPLVVRPSGGLANEFCKKKMLMTKKVMTLTDKPMDPPLIADKPP